MRLSTFIIALEIVVVIVLMTAIVLEVVQPGIISQKLSIVTTTITQLSTKPTPESTSEPTVEATIQPTTEPNIQTTTEPTAQPTPEPTPQPTEIPKSFELHQINVGCANAHLVISGDTAIMIDGGLKDSREKVISYLQNHGVTHLSAYIATHWHGDHVGNMRAILEQFGNPETLVFGNSASAPSEYMPSGKGTYQQMLPGQQFSIGPIEFTCVGPYKLSGLENCNSLNFVMKFGETTFFMTGDYTHDQVLDYDIIRDVDVFQMPHHGLKIEGRLYASNKVLQAVNPQIILVPANSSKPTNNTISALGLTAKVYNNKSGNVVIISDGTSVQVQTEK